MLDNEAEKVILTRLKTVKGHISGIERMVENKEDCADILVQISATRSAIEKIGIYLLENNAKDCLCHKEIAPEEKERIQKAVKQIIAFMK